MEPMFPAVSKSQVKSYQQLNVAAELTEFRNLVNRAVPDKGGAKKPAESIKLDTLPTTSVCSEEDEFSLYSMGSLKTTQGRVKCPNQRYAINEFF